MPIDALPVPWPEPLPGLIHYRREYRDPLGRAMRGKATITPLPKPPPTEEEKAAATKEEKKPSPRQTVVITPVAVTVELVSGVLEVDLPPDTYKLVAALRTVEGARVTDSDTVTLADSPEIDAEHVERITVT